MTAAARSGIDVFALRARVATATRAVAALLRTAGRIRPARWCVLMCSGLLPILLIGAWLIADAVQPVSYNPIRQTISVTSGYAGTDRWIATSALMVIGLSYLITAAGLTAIRLAARVGLVVAGGSSVGIAACPEPAHGTTPQHVVFTGLGAVAIAVWPALVARRDRHSSALVGLGVASTVTVVFLGLLGWFVLEAWRGGSVGLAERAASSIQICWPLAVAVSVGGAGPRPFEVEDRLG